MLRERGLSQLATMLQGGFPAQPDWVAVITVAGEELVAPELYASLQRRGRVKTLPDDVCAFLEEVHARNGERNARLVGTLKDVLSALNGVGVEPILLKGCATWVQPDGRLDARDSNRMVTDLDVLVRPDQMDASVAALVGAGFAIMKDDRDKPAHPAVDLGRPSDVGMVDLHQRSPGPAGITALENLHERCVAVDLDGLKAHAPSPALQVMIGMLHDQFGDGNFWRGGFNLRHLLDIANLAQRSDAPDWGELTALCHTPMLRTAMAAHLTAAKHIAGADVPEAMARGGSLHYWRQRLQFTTPAVNAAFRSIGLNHKAWRPFASRRIGGGP